MLEKMIIKEYMNHFFTPIQLSVFLDISINTIIDVLNDKELIISVLGKNGVIKLAEHKDRIDRWIYSSSLEPNRIICDTDNIVVEIANYIVDNNASIRGAASHFGIGKSTVHDYMEERLPSISIILYKKVFDVLKGNKSLKISDSFANYDTIYYEYDLLKSDYTIREISSMLGLSYQKVQRDLANRLSEIDGKLGKEFKVKLYEHQYRSLLEHQFKQQ